MKQSVTILVIDDNKQIVDLVSKALELEGYDVITASSGEMGLSAMSVFVPDMVILDIAMPGIDGLHVLELIRKKYEVPVIMLTARSEVATAHEAFVLGADDYVRKPFGTPELLARVHAKLRRSGSNDRLEKQPGIQCPQGG